MKRNLSNFWGHVVTLVAYVPFIFFVSAWLNAAHGAYTKYEKDIISKRWELIGDDVVLISHYADINAAFMAAVAHLESSLRIEAKNNNSSAKGLYQFTDRTWDVMLKRYGPEFGLDGSAVREDAYASIAMAAAYIRENDRLMRNYLRRDPTQVELYMAHVLSPKRAADIVNSKPDMKVAYRYPTAAKANMRLFYHKDGRVRTSEDFIRYMELKLYRALDFYGKVAQKRMVAYLEDLNNLNVRNVVVRDEVPCIKPEIEPTMAVKDIPEEVTSTYYGAILLVENSTAIGLLMSSATKNNNNDPFNIRPSMFGHYIERRWLF